MYILKLKNWLDEVDPYAIQRVALHKALVIATLLVFTCWIFHPSRFTAFVAPTILLSLYEMPVLSSFKQKESALLFIYTVMIICSVTFYLIFPFRVFFLFYGILFFVALYWLVSHRAPVLKNTIMLILSISVFMIDIEPIGDSQIASNIFFSSILSATVIFFSLKTLRYGYLRVWCLAEQRYISCLEKDVDAIITHSSARYFPDEINHIQTTLLFQQLLPAGYLSHAYRVSHHIRNVQFTLYNVCPVDVENIDFWQAIRTHLTWLRESIEHRNICLTSTTDLHAETELQSYAVQYLDRVIKHWNLLCDAF